MRRMEAKPCPPSERHVCPLSRHARLDRASLASGDLPLFQTSKQVSRQRIRLNLSPDCKMCVWVTNAGLLKEIWQNILKDGELDPIRTVKDFLTVRQEGNRQVQRNIVHYNLDMIIALGYRVQSQVAVRFRRWATQRLHEYIQKGFAMDDERLKQGGNFYASELFRPEILVSLLNKWEGFTGQWPAYKVTALQEAKERMHQAQQQRESKGFKMKM